MSSIYMLITYLILPIYIIRAHYYLKFRSPESYKQELNRYPKLFFGLRRRKVIVHTQSGHVPRNYIYLSNHQSHNDIFVMLDAIKEPFRFVAKKSLFENPFLGVFMKLSKSYPLDRDDARQSLLMMKQAVSDADEGVSLCIFPEGTRSQKAELLPFKDGIFSMLRKSKTPIMPVYIKESFNEKAKEIHVYYGEPIMPATYNHLKGTDLSSMVREAMENLYKQAYKSS